MLSSWRAQGGLPSVCAQALRAVSGSEAGRCLARQGERTLFPSSLRALRPFSTDVEEEEEDGYVEVPKQRLMELIKYESRVMASMRPSKLTVNFLKEFAEHPDAESHLRSAQFVHAQLPIRYAVRCSELELSPLWMNTRSLSVVRDLYTTAFRELRLVPAPTDEDSVREFEELLQQIKVRQAGVVPLMGAVVHELRTTGVLAQNNNRRQLNTILNQFFRTRINTELLVGQHLALSASMRNDPASLHSGVGWAGLLQKACRPAEVLEDAGMHAASLCDREFGTAPELEIIGHTDAKLTYFPDQLYYITFEVLKNAMRATTEHHSKLNSDGLPPVKVILSVGKKVAQPLPGGADHDQYLNIMIQDEGGGIPHRILDRVWEYSFTTVKQSPNFEDQLEKSDTGTGMYQITNSDNRGDPLAGLGFGLPLARLYAQSFGGDLGLMSLEGWGTSAFLHLDRTGDSIRKHTSRMFTNERTSSPTASAYDTIDGTPNVYRRLV